MPKPFNDVVIVVNVRKRNASWISMCGFAIFVGIYSWNYNIINHKKKSKKYKSQQHPIPKKQIPKNNSSKKTSQIIKNYLNP
jgi:hypothetical protein